MTKEEQIKNLETKIANANARIAQAIKQYKRASAKIEIQRKRAEQAKADIDRVKINIANQLVALQNLKKSVAECIETTNPSEPQTYQFAVTFNPEKAVLL